MCSAARSRWRNIRATEPAARREESMVTSIREWWVSEIRR